MDTREAAFEPSYLPGSASNFVLQPWGTEVPGAAGVVHGCCGFFRQHLHAAYRIDLGHYRICHV